MARRDLIAANAPFWAAEAELCRAYFASPTRTRHSDLRWIAAQAAKELVDGVEARTDSPRVMAEEQSHLDAFRDAYEQLRGDDAPHLTDAALHDSAHWPANRALRDLRAKHHERHGEIGRLAGIITEGGAATLFREGAALAGRGGADELIAAACAVVLDDEERHAADAIDVLVRLAPDEDGWGIAISCTVEQSRQRLFMRAEQFAHPLPDDRFARLVEVGADPTALLAIVAPTNR